MKKWRLKSIFIVMGLAALFLHYHHSTNAAGDPPGLPVNPLADVPPAIGTINGHKLSIPHYYLLSGVQYQGEEPLMMTPRTFTPTFESKIEDFAIQLRLSNLQPIRTQQDKHDNIVSDHTLKPDYYETWTTIGFSPKNYEKDGFLQSRIVYWRKEAAYKGPYKLEKPIYGLAHENSVKPIDYTGQDSTGHYEFYYNPVNYKTFIYCNTFIQKVSPHDSFSRCHHVFLIPEINIEGEAIYTQKNLRRWREIEAHSREIIHSFIVQ